MSQKTHYDHLELPPTASADEIKKSFRALIARYHPDKVQHLGQEFQELAQTRTAELTEAYATLSESARRAEYDLSRTAGVDAKPAPARAGSPAETPEPQPPGDGSFTM